MENIEELKGKLEYIKEMVQEVEGKIESLKLEKEDKFAELKEAHKNGAVIQYYSNLRIRWMDVPDNNPLWFDHLGYRIKPEEKPQIGDVCKFWDYDEKFYDVSKLIKIIEPTVCGNSFLSKSGVYKNAKKITKEEAIELLFGNDNQN